MAIGQSPPELADLIRRAHLWDRFRSLWEASEDDMLEGVGALVDEDHGFTAPAIDPGGPSSGFVGETPLGVARSTAARLPPGDEEGP